MKFPKHTFEKGQLSKAIKDYLAACKKDGKTYYCRCGEAIRSGWIATFPIDKNDKLLDETENPVAVPYCEKCDPPDGFNHSYALRIFVRV